MGLFAEYGERTPPFYLFLLKNRWCRIVIITWAQVWTTCVFYGWQNMSAIFFASGAYSWQCKGIPSIATSVREAQCKAQNNSVQTLFTVYLSGTSATAIISGYMYDHLGPLVTAAAGQIMYFLAWVCLIYSSQSFQFYIPSCFFLGFSVLLIGFPSLVCRELFPSHPGLAISIVVSAQTFSTIVPLAIDKLWTVNPSWVYTSIMWVYFIVFVIPTAILFVFAMPLHHPEVIDKSVTTAYAENISLKDTDARDNTDTGPNDIVVGFDTSQPLKELSDSIDESKTDLKVSSDLKIPYESKKSIKERIGVMMKELWSEMRTVKYIAFTIFFILGVLVSGFYPTIVYSVQGEKVSSFLGVITPTQAVPCLILGFLIDYVGCIIVAAAVVISNILTYSFALTTSIGGHYSGAVFYIISLSYTYTISNVYVDKNFGQKHFGTLIGVMATLAGVILLINIPIQDQATNSDNFKPSIVAYLATSFATGGILLFLSLWDKKGFPWNRASSDSVITAQG